MKVKIDVTQADIDNGLPGRCTACPIARALSRALSRRLPRLHIEAGYGKVHLFNSLGYSESIKLPPLASAFITKFDDGEPVHPFTFEIDIP